MDGFFDSNNDAYKDFPEPSLPSDPSSRNPPQIFGNYAQDGSLLPATFNTTFQPEHFDYGFGDFEYADQGDQDNAEYKRRRIARACDLCRRRKIKCDGRLPCSHCKNYNSECVYHFEQKARKPVKT